MNDVLARIDASTPSRSEFTFWCKRPPKPPDLQASQPAAAAASPAEPAEKTEPSGGPARDTVARALAADIVNLRSDYDTALCMNEYAQGFNTALCLLAVLQSFIMVLGPPGPHPAAGLYGVPGPAEAARVDGPGVTVEWTGSIRLLHPRVLLPTCGRRRRRAAQALHHLPQRQRRCLVCHPPAASHSICPSLPCRL